MTYTLIDNLPRAVLGEGRQKGLGKAFCSHKDGVLTTVMPITTCKEYDNEIIYAEHTGRTGSAYGLTVTKQGLFEGTDYAYMVMSVLGQGPRDPKPYAGMETDIAALNANHAHMQTMVRWFEDAFHAGAYTEITCIKDNMYAVRLPLFWTRTTYLTSLFGLVLRVGMYWDGAGDAYAFFKGYQGADAYHVTSAVPKIERMLKGEFPAQDLMAYTSSPHALGIVQFQFPALPVPIPAAPRPEAEGPQRAAPVLVTA